MEVNLPKVSVLVQTYQQASFISTCLDSIISQKTAFPIEIIIGEDCSTDGTREICQEYAAKYPNLIRLFLRSRDDVIYVEGKATGRYNFIKNLQAARGKYIALCEGDDYWVDPYKLAKQVSFLEERQDFVLVFNSYDKLINDQRIPGVVYEGEVDFEGFMKKDSKKTPIQTGSALFVRNTQDIEFFSRYFKQTQTGDYALFLLTLCNGKAFCQGEIMSVYRMHPGGVSNNLKPQSWFKIRLSVINTLLKQAKIPQDYVPVTETYLRQVHKNYAALLIRNGQLLTGIKHLVNSNL